MAMVHVHVLYIVYMCTRTCAHAHDQATAHGARCTYAHVKLVDDPNVKCPGRQQAAHMHVLELEQQVPAACRTLAMVTNAHLAATRPVDKLTDALRNNPNDATIQWRAGYVLFNYNASCEEQAFGCECVERAARSDTVVGRVAHAYCMMLGLGRSQDGPGAARLLGELVATTGTTGANPDAQHLLGLCYYGWGTADTGVQKNMCMTEAVRLWALAAEQGHALAQYDLGVRYCYGLGGLQQDKAKAKQLWQLAAAQVHMGAIKSLADMHM